ncbi:MAG: DUF4357 domain-containing protein [Deltaproteobacteria bacterium]|nr:DUF4357 domain-containing protein [Deltaproteobacteria bacterium]
MEEFLEQTRMLASVLGVTVFETAEAIATHTDPVKEPELFLAGDGYEARAVVRQGQVVVLKGSVARLKEAPSLGASSRALRTELLDAGVLATSPTGLTFTQDYAFDSASGAAQAINGANVNGRISWKLADGRTFKDWQNQQLPTAPAPQ